MNYTDNYNLRKPEPTDPVDIQDLNYNADAIDGKLKEIEDWEAAHLQASNPHSITPALIGAETPQGAQSRVDVVAGRVDALEQDYTEHKSDYELHKDTVKLKVAKLEQEVKRYKELYEQSNPTQSPRVTSTGYGVVSLPKNAGQGPMDVKVEGLTLKNELDYNPETWEEWVLADNASISNGLVLAGTGSASTSYLNINAKSNTKYGLLLNVLENSINGTFRMSNSLTGTTEILFEGGLTGPFKKTVLTQGVIENNYIGFNLSSSATEGEVKISDIRLFELPPGSEIESDFETLSADELARKYPYVQGGEPRNTSGTFRVRSVNEDETISSEQYVNGPELRSLPNGTKDEVSGGQKIQRIKEHVLQASDIVFAGDQANTNAVFVAKPLDYVGRGVEGYIKGNATISGMNEGYIADDISTIGNFNSTSLTAFLLRFAKGTYPTTAAAQAALEGTKLTYQLATPIKTPVQVSGSVQSYPAGTVYVEPAITDAGVYDGGFAILNTDYPIAELESVQKIDFQTGLSTELDVGQAVIAGGGLSFTHTGLSDGDIVFVKYKYDDSVYTAGKATCEYYDSRFVLKDTVTGKYYRKVETVEDGELVTQLVEV